MPRIRTAEDENLLECDACGRIERLDYIRRPWVESDFFRMDTMGGGPLEDANENRLSVLGCSEACFKLAMKHFIIKELHGYMKPRSS